MSDRDSIYLPVRVTAEEYFRMEAATTDRLIDRLASEKGPRVYIDCIPATQEPAWFKYHWSGADNDS